MNKLIAIFGLFFLIHFFSSCGKIRSIATLKKRGQAQLINSPENDTLIFRLKGGHIVSNINLNNKSTSFIFDTGINTSIDKSYAIKNGLEIIRKNNGKDKRFSESVKTTDYKIAMTKLKKLNHTNVLTIPKKMAQCTNSYGFIGSDIFNSIGSIGLLPRAQKIVLNPLISKKLRKTSLIKALFQHNPFVRLVYNNKTYKALWDWGNANDFVVFYNPESRKELDDLFRYFQNSDYRIDTFLSSNSLIKPIQGAIFSNKLSTIYKVSLEKLSFENNLNFNINYDISFIPNDKKSGLEFVIGYGVIKQFNSFLDYKNETLSLELVEKVPQVKKIIPKIIISSTTNKITVLHSSQNNSGLDLKDSVLCIGGSEINEIKGDDICTMGKKIQDALKMTKSITIKKANGSFKELMLR